MLYQCFRRRRARRSQFLLSASPAPPTVICHNTPHSGSILISYPSPSPDLRQPPFSPRSSPPRMLCGGRLHASSTACEPSSSSSPLSSACRRLGVEEPPGTPCCQLAPVERRGFGGVRHFRGLRRHGAFMQAKTRPFSSSAVCRHLIPRARHQGPCSTTSPDRRREGRTRKRRRHGPAPPCRHGVTHVRRRQH